MKNLALSHFTTWHFVKALKPQIEGAELIDAYKVSKEQWLFVFEGRQGIFHIIFYLSGHNAFFWKQQEYGKPRSKYTSLFTPLVGQRVSAIHTFEKERSFAINLESGALFFGLFGRTNLIRQVETPNGDSWKLDLPKMGEKVFQSTEVLTADVDFVKLVLGKSVTKEQIGETQRAILSGEFDLARKSDGELIFTYGHPESLFRSKDVFECLARYAKTWFKEFKLASLQQVLRKHLEKEKKRHEKTATAAEKQIERINNDLNYRLWADLLMANLYNLKAGTTRATLQDFTGENEVVIPLKSKLNIQENAAHYYRKAKNQSKEVDVLTLRLDKAMNGLIEVEEHLAELGHATDVKSLTELERRLLGEPSKGDKEKASPFLEFDYHGFKIYVGRNSKNNDELTLGFASKNDLWLHAKDLAGSHVVIRNKGSETKFPKHVIERAAEIAAYYSKGKSQGLCPVLYTFKKYVRKPKGAPAGAVLVDREDVLLVKPSLKGED